MFQQQVFIINTILMVLDALCVIIAGYCAFYSRGIITNSAFAMNADMFILSVIVIMVANNYLMGKMHLYDDKKHAPSLVIAWPIFQAVVVDFVILSTILFMLKMVAFSRLFFLLFATYLFAFLVAQRILAHIYISKNAQEGFNVNKIVIVGSVERTKIVEELLVDQLSWGHKVVGRLSIKSNLCDSKDCLGSIDDLPEVLRCNEIDEVVFALSGDKRLSLSNHLDLCRKMGILVRILPSLWKEGDSSLSVEHCQNVPFITIRTQSINATGLLYKRLLDLLGGVIGIMLFLMMYPVLAIMIKLDSPGPVLFKQKRVGQNGRIFYLYKFRSMFADAEQQKEALIDQNTMNGAMFKMVNDPRITKVGAWLRKTSLDEFPQFINVIKGEMSLVGTRPPTPDEVLTYSPEHLKRISSKPGITGLWQISGRNEIKDFQRVVELDCQYLDRWRFVDDIIIIVKTVFVVLKRKGAI